MDTVPTYASTQDLEDALMARIKPRNTGQRTRRLPMLKSEQTCATCAKRPDTGQPYKWECMECSRWWPDEWQEKNCDNCRHQVRDAGEEPCFSCAFGWKWHDSDETPNEADLMWEPHLSSGNEVSHD